MLPSPEQLQKAWKELQEIHKEYLSVHNVKIPSANLYSEKAKSLWLAVLHYYKDREVHKDEISRLTQRDIPRSAADQQVRHLKRDGWEIDGSKPGFHKLNPYRPSAEFSNTHARKQKRLEANDFNDIKIAYGKRCATCGATEGRPDPRYGNDIVELQQGHQDPEKPGDSLENIIPQCQFCNQTYKNDFVFDDKGRVKAVATIKPVERATVSVQRRIFEWLSEKFGGSAEKDQKQDSLLSQLANIAEKEVPRTYVLHDKDEKEDI